MSHVSHMNESCLSYEWVMSLIWMSHVSHMNESCLSYEWVMSHVLFIRETRLVHIRDITKRYEWVMSRVWVSRVLHMKESCCTCEKVMSHMTWRCQRDVWYFPLWMSKSYLLYDTFHWKCYTPEIFEFQKLRFLFISQNKLRFWFNLNFYRGIWVSGFGDFWGCNVFSEMVVNRCSIRPRPQHHGTRMNQHVTHCNTPQNTWTHRKTLEHTAKHLNTPQNTATGRCQRGVERCSLRSHPRTQFQPPFPEEQVLRPPSSEVCCSVLQCLAACCSVLQCVAVCCSVLQCVAVCCSV